MRVRDGIVRDGIVRARIGQLLPFALGFFCLGNLIRCGLALQYAVQLPDVPGSASFVYVAVTCAGWTVVFAICTIAAVLRLRWAAWAAILAAVFNQTHVWVDRLVFSRSSESFQTLGFAAFISFLLLLLITIPALAFRHAKSRSENRQTTQIT